MRTLNAIPLIAIILLVSGSALGETWGKLYGTVTDITTGDPVINASVAFEGNQRGAYTDLEGSFAVFRIPAGVHTAEVFCLDYYRLTITDIEIIADRTSLMDIKLYPISVKNPVTIVKYEKPDSTNCPIWKRLFNRSGGWKLRPEGGR